MTEMQITVSVPVEVSREALVLWVDGMLNIANTEGPWTHGSRDIERELDILDNMIGNVSATEASESSDTNRAACVVAIDMMDVEKRLQREVSQRLIARLGPEHQAAKVVEELAECIAAFVQFRNGRKSWTDLAKEVADVLTVVEHIPHIIEPALPLRINAEKFQAVVRNCVSGNWDNLSHMASDYEDVES